MMILFDYFRSTAAYRVRIALNLKQLDYARDAVNLVDGEQHGDAYRRRNPQGLVPALELDDGTILTQSLAICEYLEETHPRPALLPAGAVERARVRALALAVACDIHPINNLRVLKYLTGTLEVSDDARLAWYRHWVATGLSALESMLPAAHGGRFCHGDTPTLADVCLVPQIYNARRFDCDLAPYPTLMAVVEACEALPAFDRAHPSRQANTR